MPFQALSVKFKQGIGRCFVRQRHRLQTKLLGVTVRCVQGGGKIAPYLQIIFNPSIETIFLLPPCRPHSSSETIFASTDFFTPSRRSSFHTSPCRIFTLPSKAAEGRLGWGKTTGGLGNGSPPAGSRGGAPLGGPRDEVLQKLNNFKSSYKQILRIFGSISHIFTYICLCFFSVLAGIIPLSLRNGGGI